jgi:hypothetical protein
MKIKIASGLRVLLTTAGTGAIVIHITLHLITKILIA